MSMDDLVARMGDKAISKNSISRIERGLLCPSARTLEAIACACNVPQSYFYDSDVSIGKLDFRFAKTMPVKEAERIEALVTSDIQKYFSVEKTVNPEGTEYNPLKRMSIGTYDDVENVAVNLRKKMYIGNQPIFSVYELLMNCGVRIIEVDIKNDDFLGVSTFVCDYIPVVVINSRVNTTTERKRFTALHELAHLILNIKPLSETAGDAEENKYSDLSYKVSMKRPTTERICNYFAAAMLLPQPCIYARLGHRRTGLSLSELISIRCMYGISIAATVHRCHDLAIIDDTEYDNLYDNMIKKNTMETGWGEFPIKEKADRMQLLEERIRKELL